MPVLGALFRSNAFQRGQTELVIIVTPIIVNPTTGKRVATPIDSFVPPNDFERILLGRFQGKPEQVEPRAEPPRQPPARRPVRLRVQVRARTMKNRFSLRAAALAAASSLALVACEQQPVGSFRNAEYRGRQHAGGADRLLQPGQLDAPRRRGQPPAELHRRRSTSRPGTTFSSTSAAPARRRSTPSGAAPCSHDLPRTPARVRIVATPQSELGSDLRTDAAEVRVLSYNKIIVKCPGNPRRPGRADHAAPRDRLLQRLQPRHHGRQQGATSSRRAPSAARTASPASPRSSATARTRSKSSRSNRTTGN